MKCVSRAPPKINRLGFCLPKIMQYVKFKFFSAANITARENPIIPSERSFLQHSNGPLVFEFEATGRKQIEFYYDHIKEFPANSDGQFS